MSCWVKDIWGEVWKACVLVDLGCATLVACGCGQQLGNSELHPFGVLWRLH